ncbi:tRNA lysidine(34) synthetase TilS [Roseomonas sp. BN140053]|uniref:tRNA lysidine(34) synthetase TilS n=1 Tax=Roseomonas sp. BN140053 TaxID=3391898 RepID=UPI0039ECDF1D
MLSPSVALPLDPAEFDALMAPLGPFAPAPCLCVGVSGGPHSLALVLLAGRWAAARGGRAVALVADHGLRPESAAEAATVAAQLTARGIETHSLSLGLAPGAALQDRARAARLDALLAAADRLGAPWLLLGQHRGDQAETTLFRLLRGSGERGLGAMVAARPAAQALVLRPLLDVPPERLEATLAAAGLVPVRDPSNDDPRFARVRLRRSLADPGGTGPAVAALAEAAAAFAARRERREPEILARAAAAAVFHPEGWAELHPAVLGGDAIAVELLSRLLRSVAGRVHPPPRAGVAALLRRGGGTLAGAQRRAGILCREPAACAPPIPARAGACWDGRWHCAGDTPGGTLGALGDDLAALPRDLRRNLPALVLRGMPALRRGGELLPWPPPGVFFSPAGGPFA